MNLLSKYPFLLVVSIFFSIGSLKAQNFYNFDNFITDSAFVIKNKIKSVTIRIPTLLDDTTNKEFIPFQKLCFNPFGKLATYEFDFSEKNASIKIISNIITTIQQKDGIEVIGFGAHKTLKLK